MRAATAAQSTDWRETCERAVGQGGDCGLTLQQQYASFKALVEPLSKDHRRRLRFAYDCPEGSRRFYCVWVVPEAPIRGPYAATRRLYAILAAHGFEVVDHGTQPCAGTRPSAAAPGRTIRCNEATPVDVFAPPPHRCRRCRAEDT